MKKTNLEMSREVWEYLREYKKIPFKQKYHELEKMEKATHVIYNL